MTIIIPGVMIHKKLYKNIKKEEHREKGKVIQRIMKTYSIIQCISWPLVCILRWLTIPESPVWSVISSKIMYYLLISFGDIYVITRDYFAFNSMIIALCRYAFTVFSTKSEKIGIKRMRNVFITCSVAIPMSISIWDICTISYKELALYSGFPQGFCRNKSTYKVKLDLEPTINCEDTAIYKGINHYIPLVIVNAIKSIHLLALIGIYSNVAEAFIYAHIYIYCAR